METQKNKRYDEVMNRTGNGIITFFTPSYNRSQFLPRVYNCIKKQTCKQVAWILVNDGSVDDTDEIAKSLLGKEEIPMLYIRKENGGKHSAFKIALDVCETEFFQCMDDDDLYDSNAVEFFLANWNEIKEEGHHDVGAIRTLSKLPNGHFAISFNISSEDLGKYEDLTTLEMNYVYHRFQENWTCYRTDALRSVDLFPTDYWLFEHHKFFLESIWQGRFARKYKCRYIYVALREYRDDATFSLIRAKKTSQHYLDMFINTKVLLDEQLDYIKRSPMNMLKMVLMVNLLRGYLDISLIELLKHTQFVSLKFFYLLSCPFSLFGKMVIAKRR